MKHAYLTSRPVLTLDRKEDPNNTPTYVYSSVAWTTEKTDDKNVSTCVIIVREPRRTFTVVVTVATMSFQFVDSCILFTINPPGQNRPCGDIRNWEERSRPKPWPRRAFNSQTFYT